MQTSDASRRGKADLCLAVIACDKREAFAQGSEAIQSFLRGKMDCFAEPVIGRAFARPVGSQ